MPKTISRMFVPNAFSEILLEKLVVSDLVKIFRLLRNPEVHSQNPS
jgi:hypothetical protein